MRNLMIVDLLKDFVDDEMVELQNDYLHLFIHKTYIINSKINFKKIPEAVPRLSDEYC
jgi:hypothetical protein